MNRILYTRDLYDSNLRPIDTFQHARWCCEHLQGFDAVAWAACEALALQASHRDMDAPASSGAYVGDDKLAHEFTLIAAAVPNARIPSMEGTRLCKHCGLEDWSRRRDQECPVRLREALNGARPELR